MTSLPRNTDKPTVEGFGREWSTFTQSAEAFTDADRRAMFDGYFAIFPWDRLPQNSVGADIGCGSGRWAMLVAPRVGHLHAIDPAADALAVARGNLAGLGSVSFHQASVSALPLADKSLDFAYALGVLHHVPDTAQAIRDIAAKLKAGAPFLLYLYYAFDNRSAGYRTLWNISNAGRVILSRAPYPLQIAATTVIAYAVYWPIARLAALLEKAGLLPRSWPLSYYRHRALYVMRTDAFDRFCTRLEQRFTRAQIADMLRAAGFDNITFSDTEPFWVAVASKI
ncbi:MAG TPA: class I SAM-dependent methyltransferase [Pseudolabrys sp.]|nr:class I SAM-dependent methyltransferase [Pseudolabrys sp.]